MNNNTSPFIFVTREEYELLSNDDKENNALYVVIAENMVQKIEPVRKYSIIIFRDNYKKLIKATKQIVNTQLVTPQVEISKSTIGSTGNTFEYFLNWQDEYQNPVSQIVPNRNTVIYANYHTIVFPNVDIVVTANNNSSEQMSINTTFLVYLGTGVDPDFEDYTFTVNQNNSETALKIKFTITNYTANEGIESTFTPCFDVYSDSNRTNKIGSIVIKIKVIKTTNSTGD